MHKTTGSNGAMLANKSKFFHYRGFTRDPLRFCEHVFRYGGDFYSFEVLGRTFHVISSPRATHHILVDQNESYGRGTTKILRPIIGQGLLSLQGEAWRSRRQLVQAFFHPREIGRLRDMLTQQIDRAVSEWDMEEGQIRLIAPFMQRLTLTIISRAFLKTDVWDLDPKVLKAIARLHKIVQRRMNRMIDWPLWVPTPENLIYKRDIVVLDKAVQEIIDSAQNYLCNHEPEDLIDHIISARDPETQQGLTAKNIRDEVMTFFLAGHETTAALLTFLMDFLARDQKLQDALREELMSLPSDYPYMRDLSRLKLLSWTITEALRLRPSAWSIFRYARKDDKIACENGFIHDVKRRDIMVLSVWNLHHHKEFWPQPEVFNPFRMEVLSKQPKSCYLPFGSGKHTCIGNNFAVFEISLIVSKLLRNYRVEAVSEKPIEVVGGITLRPASDLALRLTKL